MRLLFLLLMLNNFVNASHEDSILSSFTSPSTRHRVEGGQAIHTDDGVVTDYYAPWLNTALNQRGDLF